MKVAVFGCYAPSLLNFRGPMLEAMVAAGHEVVALAPEDDPAVRERLAALGVAYHSVPLNRTGMNPLRDLASLRAMTRTLRALKPDLILSYTIKPVIWGTLAAAKAGIPRRHCMITGLGSSLQGRGPKMGLLSLLARSLYKASLSKAHGVFFQNPDDRAFFESRKLLPAGCRITLINGSGVDLDRFAPAPLPPEPPVFLFVGRLVRDKGIFEFVEAARRLKAQCPEARCRILGPFDSNPTAVSMEQVEAWVQEGIVEHLGKKSDVRPDLHAAHVIVLPSYGEGTPRSVLEAMACGRAVITTWAPGCKETVLPEATGLLVPVRDAGALAEAMGRLAGDPELVARMGVRGRAYAEEKYDVHKVNAVILEALGLASEPIPGGTRP